MVDGDAALSRNGAIAITAHGILHSSDYLEVISSVWFSLNYVARFPILS